MRVHSCLPDATENDPNSGSFTISAASAPAFRGHGDANATPMLAELLMGTNATGNVNLTTQMWQVNYSQTSGSGSIQIHLEGTVGLVP